MLIVAGAACINSIKAGDLLIAEQLFYELKRKLPSVSGKLQAGYSDDSLIAHCRMDLFVNASQNILQADCSQELEIFQGKPAEYVLRQTIRSEPPESGIWLNGWNDQKKNPKHFVLD